MKYQLLISVIALVLLGPVACDRPAPTSVASHSEPAVSDEPERAARPDSAAVILVTGATGTQGGAVARELLERGYTVRGLTRNPESEKAQALTALGATMAAGDYDDPASLAAAMDGVDGVFAVTLFWHGGYDAEVEHGKRLIDEATKAEVKHFVLTSVASADDRTGIPHFESKWEVEQYLNATDLDWTIIRPVEFMDNWGWSLEEFRQGKLVDPRDLSSSHQWIAARDIGFFVAEAFDNPEEWTGVTREIAGDELTLAELQDVLSEVFGKEFEYVQPSWEDFEAEAGEEIADMVRWFEDGGYSVDIDALKARYPNLQTAAEFLSELAGSYGD